MISGSCRAVLDPDTWFPEKGFGPGAAKRVCGECPVVMECLSYALVTGQRYGVWGGKTPGELEEMRDRLGILDR